METKMRQMGASYSLENHVMRGYRAWVVLDFPIQPPSINTKDKLKGSENEIYNNIRLVPLEGDEWAWERYFKAKSRRDACVLMNDWIRRILRHNEYFKNKTKSWNCIAFVEDSRNEVFYCSDMDLKSDAFCYIPLDIVKKVCDSSKGELEFNINADSNAQKYSFKRSSAYKKPKDAKLKDYLFKCRKTGNYYVFFTKERYNLMTTDEKRAWDEATKVVKNIRKGLPPFDHRSGSFFDNREQNKKIDSKGQTHEKTRKAAQRNQRKNKDKVIKYPKKIKSFNVGNNFASKANQLDRIKQLEKRLKEKGVIA